MITLHNLKKHPKSTKRKKVVGRGIGSGHGTYATRGNKGQTKRTGHSKMPVGFEGGRQPLIRQVPKSRGFKSLNDKAISVSLSNLNVFSDGDVVTAATLLAKGIIVVSNKAAMPKVKLLKGELKRKLEVRVPVSSAAKLQIEQAGGSVK
jgi:large subunit ribosomal protein L15